MKHSDIDILTEVCMFLAVISVLGYQSLEDVAHILQFNKKLCYLRSHQFTENILMLNCPKHLFCILFSQKKVFYIGKYWITYADTDIPVVGQ